MGKKRSTAKAESENTNAFVDDVFSKAIADVGKKKGDEGVAIGHERLIVLPVPALSFRYLIQNEGLPLGKFYQFVGIEASFKSTMLAEVMRWHRLCGGFGVLAEAESKPTPELRNAIMRWDVNAIRVEECEALEDWQQILSWYTTSLQKRFSAASGPGPIVPVCLGVDSMMGKMCRQTIKKIEEKGHASLHFASEANLIKDFMGTFPQKLTNWPFTMVGVNHLKMGTDDNGLPVRNVPGGGAIKFQKAAEIEIGKIGRVEEKSGYKEARLIMQTYKNSYGAERIKTQVKLRLWYQNDAPEGDEPIHRLHGMFMWHTATVDLLFQGLGMTKTTQARTLPKIKEVIDIHEKAGGTRGKLYWSDRLGIASADAIEPELFGYMIEQNHELLAQLYAVLNIQRRPFFQAGVDYMKQRDEYAHVALQAEAAEVAVKRAEELNESRS
jgi:hypothetical protein